MLLSSGHSLSGAIARIGQRGHGECARGFRTVTRRIGQGLGEVDGAPRVRRARSGARGRSAGRRARPQPRGRATSAPSSRRSARLVRREVHRELVETIERRGQTVWIPVTVATLLPGVIFMAVPFVDAMRQLTG